MKQLEDKDKIKYLERELKSLDLEDNIIKNHDFKNY